MKNQNVLSIRMHQAVEFNKVQASYFSGKGARGKNKANLTLMPEIQCVLVENATDKALVPFVNIAYIKLEKLEEAKKEVKSKTKAS